MKPAAFAYTAPKTTAEVLALLAQYGADARILAGGQTLGPMLNMRIATPAVLVDINRITDLKPPAPAGGNVMTHALVRQRDALEDQSLGSKVPLVQMMLPFVGHYQTRNRGTLCGSLAHADPTAELPLALLTLGGWLHLASAKRKRKVAAADFFIGPLTTERGEDEMIIAAEWPAAGPEMRFAFREIGAHNSHSALCACAISARLDDRGRVQALTIGITAVSDRPLLVDTWRFLNAKIDAPWRQAVAEQARTSLTFVDDLHASAHYRRHITGVLIERCLSHILGNDRVAQSHPA
jgi:2-furoyl-CoA dehydrogenase FAD binding subunit